MNPRSRWLVGKDLPGRSDRRLYCFPHSGGMPSEYVRWTGKLPGVQVYGICLPARGDRLAEPAVLTMTELVDQLLTDTAFTPPYTLFGHSLGALITFEVARELAARRLPLPERLVLSAFAAPHLPRADNGLRNLPDATLARTISEKYAAMPPHVLTDPALLALLLPAFRADFTLLETYRYRPGPPLPVPVDVFGGAGDTVSVDELTPWRVHTTAGCRVHLFPGGHFYLQQEPAAPLAVLRSVLAPASAPKLGHPDFGSQ